MRPKREGAKRENTVDKTYPIFMKYDSEFKTFEIY